MAKVIVYSTNRCPWCDRVKEFLSENNVGYEERNASLNVGYALELKEKSGGLAVPVIDIDGTIVVGFNPEKIKEALGI